MDPNFMNSNDALLLVDVQRDFCSGGVLAVAGAEQVIPVLNQWIHAAEQCGARIIASRDWHPADHCSFQEQGGPWPPHCIQHTEGAAFHPDLHLPNDTEVVSKGLRSDQDNYSAFDNTAVAAELRDSGIERIFVGGLAEDICVRDTVFDARRAGFEVHLIRDATRPVDAKQGEKTLAEARQAGVFLEETQSRRE